MDTKPPTLKNAVDVTMGDATAFQPFDDSAKQLYGIFSGPDDILYTPEEALAQGLRMVKTLKASVKNLELGNKMRKDVWLREIERSVCMRPIPS